VSGNEVWCFCNDRYVQHCRANVFTIVDMYSFRDAILVFNGLFKGTFSWAPYFVAWRYGMATSVTRPFTLWLLFMGLLKIQSLHRQTANSWGSFRNHSAWNWKDFSCHARKEYGRFCNPSPRMLRQEWTPPNWCNFSHLTMLCYLNGIIPLMY